MISRVLVPQTDAYPRNGEGSVCRIDGDRLILCFTRFYGGTDDDDASSIWISESCDQGLTWTSPALLVQNRGVCNTMSVSLLSLDSRVLMAVLVKDSPARSRLECFELPHDRIHSPRFLSAFAPGGYMGFHNDRLRRLSDGRLVLPVTLCDDSGMRNAGRSKSMDYAAPRRSVLLFSTDEGASWRLDDHRIQLPKRGAMEPCVTEYEPGSLLVTLRTQLGSIYASRYTNGRWEAPRSLEVSSPEAPHTLVCDGATGRLYLVHCPTFVPDVHHYGPRYPLLIRSSTDAGCSWSAPLTIADGSDGAYEYANTSLLCTRDELLLTYYRRHLTPNRYNRKDTMLARIAKSEIQ